MVLQVPCEMGRTASAHQVGKVDVDVVYLSVDRALEKGSDMNTFETINGLIMNANIERRKVDIGPIKPSN